MPLERLVDSLVPLEMHPDAGKTMSDYQAYRAVQDQIAEYPQAMIKKSEEVATLSRRFQSEAKVLRGLKKQLDAFEMAPKVGLSTQELAKLNDDMKKTNEEFMRRVTKAREIEKDRDRAQVEFDTMEKEKPAKMTALFEQVPSFDVICIGSGDFHCIYVQALSLPHPHACTAPQSIFSHSPQNALSNVVRRTRCSLKLADCSSRGSAPKSINSSATMNKKRPRSRRSSSLSTRWRGWRRSLTY